MHGKTMKISRVRDRVHASFGPRRRCHLARSSPAWATGSWPAAPA